MYCCKCDGNILKSDKILTTEEAVIYPYRFDRVVSMYGINNRHCCSGCRQTKWFSVKSTHCNEMFKMNHFAKMYQVTAFQDTTR